MIYHATLPEKHPDRITADLSLGDILLRQGHALNEANQILISGLEKQRAVFGGKNARLIETYDMLSRMHLAQEKLDVAEQDVKMELSIATFNFGQTNINVGITHSSIAYVLLKRKEFSEAEKAALSSLKILRATTSPDHQYVASAEYLLAASLVGQHKTKEAEPMLRENMARWNRAEAPAWRAARSESLLGEALLQEHKPQEAKEHLLHADEILSAKDSGALQDEIAVVHSRVSQFKRCEAEHRLSTCDLSV